MRELEERDKLVHESRQLVDAARKEKRDCELILAVLKRDVQSLRLELQQKDAEVQRSRNFVRLLLLLL